MSPVVSRAEQRPVHIRRAPRIRVIWAGVDVLDEGGAGGGAVAPPQLDPMDPVVGGEKQGTAHVRPVVRIRASCSRIDVLDQVGAGGRAVAGPEFTPVLVYG